MQIHFNLFELDGDTRPFEAKRVTGTFILDGKEVELTLPVPKEVKGEAGSETYRRELMKVRDALSAMIADPHGVSL